MVVTVDFYKELQIDRSWDEKTIRNHLKTMQKLWTQRQGACNDKEQLLIIDKIQSTIEEAFRFLTKVIKRKQYDAGLEKAYKDGTIIDDVEEKLQGLVAQAKAYYKKGKIKSAAQVAMEAIKGKVNDPEAYEILARCYWDAKQYDNALLAVDKGIAKFKENIQLHWLGARISTNGKKNFDESQKRINRILEIAPENPLGYTEQIYMHLRKGEEELAFQEIDTYVEAHPTNEEFKKFVAYDLNYYSNKCLYNDQAQNTAYIADKRSYEDYLRLNKKAVELYEDEHTINRLEHAKFFGKKEWNSWNEESIKTLTIYGIIFTILLWPFGLFLLAMDAVLVYFSFRPYWQINKTYLTGQMGAMETLINRAGNYLAIFARWFLGFLIKLVGWILKFCLWLATGGPFRNGL